MSLRNSSYQPQKSIVSTSLCIPWAIICTVHHLKRPAMLHMSFHVKKKKTDKDRLIVHKDFNILAKRLIRCVRVALLSQES
jgi:hypothetical protein